MQQKLTVTHKAHIALHHIHFYLSHHYNRTSQSFASFLNNSMTFVACPRNSSFFLRESNGVVEQSVGNMHQDEYVDIVSYVSVEPQVPVVEP